MGKTNNDFSLLLASSVHDMKNSLGMLLNSLEELIAEHPPQNPEHSRRYAILQGETSRIRNDLIYLLGIYRYDRDELPVQIDEVFVDDFLQQQLALNELLFQIRDIRVSVECEPDVAGYFDEELISGVINNVLVNAAKYTKNSVRLVASQQNEFLRIQIIDNGPGYPDAMIRAPRAYLQSIDFSSGSTNLGLYFAAQIAGMHQRGENTGYILLENLNEGGCFSLYLP